MRSSPSTRTNKLAWSIPIRIGWISRARLSNTARSSSRMSIVSLHSTFSGSAPRSPAGGPVWQAVATSVAANSVERRRSHRPHSFLTSTVTPPGRSSRSRKV